MTCTDSNKAPLIIAKAERELSIADSLDYPLISTQGDRKSLIPQIVRIVEYFLTLTGREMEEFQRLVLAGDLYEQFRTDALEDIALMFKMARTGEFGKVYRGDYLEIMGWVPKYLEKKAEQREKKWYAEKAQNTPKDTKSNGIPFHMLPKEMQEKFNAIGKPKEGEERVPIITEKGREMMSREKHLRSLQNEDKRKKEIW